MSRKVANRQIFDKTSLTNRLVSITCSLIEGSNVTTEALALVTSLILDDCAYYQQSNNGGVLCASGESNGKMLVPQACNRCVVGQFSQSGKFLGELVNPDMHPSSEDSNIF